MKLNPGEVRPVRLDALLCCCTRCGYGSDGSWLVVSRRAGRAPKPPKACSSCKTTAWAYPLDEAGPGRRRKSV